MSDETLLLVDGSSYLFRAFHALPDLRNDAGEPTGAIHGLVGMLRRLRDDTRLHGDAWHGAVVFDAPGRTFRDDWYAEYKANRKETPPDLRSQIAPIHELTVALGWPLIVVPGVEADDIIGTLARQAQARGMRTIISTGDKDLAQLVNEHCELVNTMTRDGSPPERMGIEGVKAKFGVGPDRIVDYLSLIGDAVDNVPGVDKVGPKTAVKWLEQYGSLDGVIAHAAEIKGKVGENLRAALDWLPMARRLVTVKIDCELPPGVDDVGGLRMRDEDVPALLALFERWGLRTYARRLQAAGTTAVGDGGFDPAGSGAQRAIARGRAGANRVTRASSGQGVLDGMDAGVPGAGPDGGAGVAADPGADAGTDAGGDSGTGSAASATAPQPAYETVADEAALARWVERIETAELTSFDTETTSLDAMQARIVGLSIALKPYEGCYIPLAHQYTGAPAQLDRDAVLARLKPWLESDAHRKVGQNLKYDMHVLENHGIRLRGIAHDTMLESYVLEAHRTHGMDALAARHLHRQTITFEDVAGKGAKQITFDQVDIERATEYAAEDAEVTMQLHQALWPRIEQDPKLLHVYRDLELPTAIVLQRMERRGVRVDVALLQEQSDRLGRGLLELEAKAADVAGQPFNMGSPKQLGEILFGRLGLPVLKKTAGGSPSTDEDVLERLAADYPLPRIVLDWRSLAKLKSTYTDKLPRMVDPQTGRVHTTYSQAVAATGRLSSVDPNLQNIPVRTAEGRRIREAFIADAGHRIVSADYSQIELRIMAHISGDRGLLDAFANGIDVHRATAAEVFGAAVDDVTPEQRRYAKVINFGLIYGMSAFGLASNLGIDRESAKNWIDRYFSRYPKVAQYMEDTRALAHEQHYVETVFGRRLWLAEINSPSGPRRAAAERAAINAPMQGTAADLIKLAMIDVQDWIDAKGLGARLIMQVHDELVLEVPDGEVELLREALPARMAGVAQLAVPLEAEVGVGPNWEQAH